MVNTPGEESKPARRAAYRSPLRDTQAAQTRERVLEAAADLFTRAGYLRSTMRDVAEAAGVSVETVYAQGSKQSLLLAAVDRALAGPHGEVPLIETEPVVQALVETTAESVVRGFAEALTDVAVRAAGLLVAFEDAAASDAKTSEVWAQSEQRRRQDYRHLVETVATLTPLREGLTVDRAVDGLWCTLTPRLARHLLGAGWTRDQVADWAAALATSVLLGAQPGAPA